MLSWISWSNRWRNFQLYSFIFFVLIIHKDFKDQHFYRVLFFPRFKGGDHLDFNSYSMHNSIWIKDVSSLFKLSEVSLRWILQELAKKRLPSLYLGMRCTRECELVLLYILLRERKPARNEAGLGICKLVLFESITKYVKPLVIMDCY